MDTIAPPPAPEVPPAPPPPPGGAPTVVLELLGYIGVAAAFAATAIAFDTTSLASQIVIPLAVTVSLVVLGWLVGVRDEALQRMRGVFWFVAVLSWTSVASVLMGPDGLDLQDKWLVVAIAALVAVVAVPLWLRERRSLQLIAAFVSLHVTLAALVFTMTTESFFGFEQEVPNLRWSALVTALFGVAGLVLGARELVRPRRTAMVLGAIALFVGLPLVFTDVVDVVAGSGSDLPTWIGLLAGAIVLVVGSRTGVVAVTGLGIVQVLGSVVMLVTSNVEDTGPAIAVLVAGLAVLGVVVFLARQRPVAG
ncbi:MAG TPA: hypothetical protein VF235_07735 [Actinomycetota bacterium]